MSGSRRFRSHRRQTAALFFAFFSITASIEVFAAAVPRFSSPRAIAIGSPYGVAGDVSGDGKVDVLLTRQREVLLLLGKGDGRFEKAKQVFKASRGSLPQPTLADFDHDGKLDLAVLTQRKSGVKGTVVSLRGNGDGTFQPATALVVTPYANFILPAQDFTGDGNVDLAIRSTNPGCNPSGTVCIPSDDTVSVLPGRGDGSFLPAPANTPSANLGDYGGRLMAADIDHDGLSDVVVVSRKSATAMVRVLKGSADGVLRAGEEFAIGGLGYYPLSQAAADFNGDGKVDLAIGSRDLGCRISHAVCSSENGQVSILLGQGNGTFWAEATVATGAAPNSLAAADFDGDGRIDLAAGTLGSRSGILLLQGAGDGSFTATWQTRSRALGTSNVQAADFDDDGQPDLLAVPLNQARPARLLLNQTR